MQKRNIFIWFYIIVPVIIMFTLAYLSFSNLLDDRNSEGLIIASLILYYPVLFFLQGLLCALLKVNIFLSFGFSIAAYIIITFVWLNSSALIYLFVYLIVGLLGYYLTFLIKKVINK